MTFQGQNFGTVTKIPALAGVINHKFYNTKWFKSTFPHTLKFNILKMSTFN
jgi:hypothetical protein